MVITAIRFTLREPMPTPSIGNRVTQLIMVALGLLLLLPAAVKLTTYGQFRYRAVAAEGRVVGPLRGRGLGGRPFVEYRDRQGNVYERKSRAKTHWFFAPQSGEILTVFYDPRDPAVAMVNSNAHYIFFPLCFMSAGAGCLYCVFRNRFRR